MKIRTDSVEIVILEVGIIRNTVYTRTIWVELLVTDFATLICIPCFFCITLFVVVAEWLDTAKLGRSKCAVIQQVIVEFILVHHRSFVVDGRVVVVVVVGQRRDHQHLSQHMFEDVCFSSTIPPWRRSRCG